MEEKTKQEVDDVTNRINKLEDMSRQMSINVNNLRINLESNLNTMMGA